MLKKLTLENFKNFRHAELELGPFTVLIGANATGKSNIREAFRFLHGIGRGYTLPEIIGEKYSAGERVWDGIRGGTREIAYQRSNSFALKLDFGSSNEVRKALNSYFIQVKFGEGHQKPALAEELLTFDNKSIFKAYPKENDRIKVETDIASYEDNLSPINRMTPYLASWGRGVHKSIDTTVEHLQEMRFFNLAPHAMRTPSEPSQTNLGDRGENLSSVLYDISQDTNRKQVLFSWLRELTPMDVVDFAFPGDQIGRILVSLVERDGNEISAYSASDGTLRLLGLLAALLGPEPARFYYFEELENGIHPTRLHLLTRFIENQVDKGEIQVVATTHSPLLLNFLKPETLEHASLLYRLEDQPDAHIKRIVDIPDARRLIERQSVMRLYESGWFEDAVFFLGDEEPTPDTEAIA